MQASAHNLGCAVCRCFSRAAKLQRGPSQARGKSPNGRGSEPGVKTTSATPSSSPFLLSSLSAVSSLGQGPPTLSSVPSTVESTNRRTQPGRGRPPPQLREGSKRPLCHPSLAGLTNSRLVQIYSREGVRWELGRVAQIQGVNRNKGCTHADSRGLH